MSSMTFGTTTFPAEPVEIARIVDVTIDADTLLIRLNDGRAILLNMTLYPWLRWLLDATSEQRQQWELVPSGGGVWWPALDEGIELRPLLDLQPLVSSSTQSSPQMPPR